ncbi:MAG: hypothetical protein PUH24_00800 [Prevotellaceae bacterium]|nr:hypothetical protein [Prevotella sp.]MDD7256820.1 hypothetical protein [Prevotellaceae bacterium]MDY6131150.1 hypothetical protein [Prevotella sp.]
MMTTKTNYVSPVIEMVKMQTQGSLADGLSMRVDEDTPAWGGGDAKGTDFFEEPEEDTDVFDTNLWDRQ